MGQEIIDIFYFRADKSQKSADPVRTELSFDSSSTSVRNEVYLNLGYYRHCLSTPGMISVCCTRHPYTANTVRDTHQLTGLPTRLCMSERASSSHESDSISIIS